MSYPPHPGGRITERQIAAFRAVMLAGGVSGAARAMNLSQPAVSTALRRLEDVLGRPLFDRVAGRMIPTVEAGRILAEVTPLYDALDRLADRIGLVARGEGATFRVGATPSVAVTLVPRALARLRAAHPDLSVEFETPALDRVAPLLLLGGAACVATIARVDHPSLESEVLGEGGLTVVLPAAHPLASRASLTVPDIAGEPLVSFPPGAVHGALIDAAFAAAGHARRTATVVRSAASALALVGQGFGIAVLDPFSAEEAPMRGLAAVPLLGGPRVTVHLHRARLAPRSPLVAEFAAAVRGLLDPGAAVARTLAEAP